MFPAMVPAIPSSNITTEQIQKVSSFFPLCIFPVLFSEAITVRLFGGNLCGNVFLASLFFYLLKFQYLDENKKLIMAIMENQNLGKLAECAQ